MRQLELEYIGRPTHYQVEVELRHEAIRIEFPNGRVPIHMDFVGERTYRRPKYKWFFGLLTEPERVQTLTAIAKLPYNYETDDKGNHYANITSFEHCHARGVLRFLLVEPCKEESGDEKQIDLLDPDTDRDGMQ